MNGRIYDPGIGRFLSADPYVQFAFNTQSFNRYSYVLNNPLSFKDPSGFGIWDSVFAVFKFGIDLVRWATGHLSTNAFIASFCTAVAYLTLSTIPWGGPFFATLGAGFTSAFMSTLLSGASLGQAVEAGTIAGTIAAATYGVLRYGIPTLANALKPTATVANTGGALSQSNPSGLTFGAISYHVRSGADAGRICLFDNQESILAAQEAELPTATAEHLIIYAPPVDGAAAAASQSGFDWGSIFRRLPFWIVPQFLAADINMRVLGGNRNTNFFEDWMTGASPNRINYGPTSPQTLDMRQSPGAAQMRADFNASGDTFSRTRYDTPRAYLETIADPRANRYSTALQVGGFDGATVINNGDGTASFTITNVAGAHSFFYHLVPNSPFTWGPMHNVTQEFTWTEPIGP